MKRIVLLILVLVMTLSLSVTAFAAEGDQTNVEAGEYSAEVTGTYVAGTTGGTVFSVDIAWDDLSFTYHAEQEPVWNVNDHTYSDAVDAYWEGEGTITVTNHSNVKITATPKFNAADGYESAEMAFNTYTLRVASAADHKVAQTGMITVTPSGYLPEMEKTETIGTITVTIAEDKGITVSQAESLLGDIAVLETMIEMDSELYSQYAEELNRLLAQRDEYEIIINNYKNGTETQENFNSGYEEVYNTYMALKTKTGL